MDQQQTRNLKPETPARNGRRALLGGVGAAMLLGPASWRKPVVDAVLLPAHAALSEPLIDDIVDPAPEPPLANCAVGRLETGDSLSLQLSESVCSTASGSAVFITIDCLGGEITVTFAPGIQWNYVSSTPAANPVVIPPASGSTNVEFVVERVVSGQFYFMQFSAVNEAAACTVSDIAVYGPFSTAAEAMAG